MNKLIIFKKNNEHFLHVTDKTLKEIEMFLETTYKLSITKSIAKDVYSAVLTDNRKIKKQLKHIYNIFKLDNNNVEYLCNVPRYIHSSSYTNLDIKLVFNEDVYIRYFMISNDTFYVLRIKALSYRDSEKIRIKMHSMQNISVHSFIYHHYYNDDHIAITPDKDDYSLIYWIFEEFLLSEYSIDMFEYPIEYINGKGSHYIKQEFKNKYINNDINTFIDFINMVENEKYQI